MTAAAREIQTASVGVRSMNRALLEVCQFVAFQGKNEKNLQQKILFSKNAGDIFLISRDAGHLMKNAGLSRRM